MVSTYHRADTQRVSEQGKEMQKPLCDWLYSLLLGSQLEGPVAAYVSG